MNPPNNKKTVKEPSEKTEKMLNQVIQDALRVNGEVLINTEWSLPEESLRKRFLLFKKEFMRQVERLGLKSWCITFQIKHLKDDAIAQVATDSLGRNALVTFNSKLFIEADVLSVAKHEAAHLLMADLVYYAANRYCTANQISMEEEKIAIALEKCL